jgi:hypothetical protein
MPPNLGDPSVEPTDEELQGLAHDAFAGVGAALDRAREQLRARIRVLRAEALREASTSGPSR